MSIFTVHLYSNRKNRKDRKVRKSNMESIKKAESVAKAVEVAKAVVFDFNGTLFFDYQENKDAWDEVSLKYRGRHIEEEEHDRLMGMIDPICVRAMLGDLPYTKLVEIGNEKEEIYLRLCQERHLTLEESAVQFIKRLKDLGIKTLIASSAPKMNMDWYYENLGLKDLFDPAFIIAGREDLPSKPNPDIFQYALKLAQTSPSEAICFEDSPNGLRAALAANFKKVYGILSPGLDNTVQKTLAPMLTWPLALSHFSEIITL